MMRKKHFAILAVLSTFALFPYLSAPAHAQGTYQWSMVAEATPDECYQGDVNNGLSSAQIAANNSSFSAHYPAGLSASDIASCVSSGFLPKINQAYVWGLTMNGADLWFGTVANTLCLVEDGYYGTVPSPSQNSSWVCDAKENQMEDFKPPRLFVYNSATNGLTDLTSRVLAGGGAALLTKTVGIRSAGNYGGVVFFAGLMQAANKATPVAMYAFNAATQQYLGSYLFDGSDANHPYYNDIRQWHVINGQLFTGVGKPSSGVGGGAMLRWTGTLAAPFSFVEVGHMQGEPAYFVAHTDGHIYVTTWGSAGKQYGMSLYMSPVLNQSTGLDATDADNWTEVWNLKNYEVEPSAIQVGGAIESFNGYLYFGTMQVPGTPLIAFATLYPSGTINTTTELDTYRAISIFRTQGYDSTLQPTPSVELLYGSTTLPKYDSATDTWSTVPNNMGATPTYGAAGFGNLFNNYTWSMSVFQKQLYIGTMDWSFLASNGNESSSIPAAIRSIAPNFYGADLWTFADSSSAATAVSITGLGNYTSYGIRTMVNDNENLWIGMANPMNLRSDTANYPGGWKLIDFPMQDGAPIITWYNPVPITYGTPLTATQLNATSTQSGTFTYTPPLGTVLNAGPNQMLSLSFYPFTSGNVYSDTVNLTVNPEPLSATAANATMVYGTAVPAPLTGSLAGVVNNDGITASYTTLATSASPAGPYTITTALNDPKTRLSNYAVTLTNGTLTISKAATMTSASATAPSVLVKNTVTLTTHVASTTTGTPTGTVTFMDGSTALGSVTLDASGNAQLPISTLAAGSHLITVAYPGDGNFTASTSSVISEMVQDFQFNIGTGSVVSVTILPGRTATFTLEVAPTYGTYFPNPVTLTLSGLPTSATGTITPSTIPTGNGSTPVVVVVQTGPVTASNHSFPSGLTFACLFLPVVGLFTLRRRARGAGLLMLMVLGLAIMVGVNGCGSSSGIFAQAPQTSTITVTGTCGTLQHTATLNLTVQ